MRRMEKALIKCMQKIMWFIWISIQSTTCSAWVFVRVFFFSFLKISSTTISYKQVETGLKDWIRRRAEEEIAKQVEMMRR